MAAKKGNADRVLEILQRGQRTSCDIAKKRLGLTVRQYQRAIAALRDRGFPIDSDLTAVTRKGTGRVWIATHQLVRNA